MPHKPALLQSTAGRKSLTRAGLAKLLMLVVVLARAGKAGDSFKTLGSPSAPMVVELFSDYQCDACRSFHANVLPAFVAAYVLNGKARLIVRDFPLPSHRMAQLAAIYANAAGQVGKFDQVTEQLFRRQQEWSSTGDLEGVVSSTVSSTDLVRIRELVKRGETDSIAADKSEGNREGVVGTPTLLVTYGGRRVKIPGVLNFALLKSFLDQILAGSE